MENIDKKIEETWQSIEGIQSAKAPDYLFAATKARIEKKAGERKEQNKMLVSKNYLLRVACVFVGLIFFNLLILKKSDEVAQTSEKPNAAKVIADNYFSSTIYNY